MDDARNEPERLDLGPADTPGDPSDLVDLGPADTTDGRGELLDLGVLGEEPPGEPVQRPRPSRRALLLTLGGVTVGGGLLAARGSSSSAALPEPAPSPSPSPTFRPRVTTSRLARPVPGVPPAWTVFGVGPDSVVRVDGTDVTRTRIRPLPEGQVFVVPTRRGVVVRPLGIDRAWVVRDEQPPVALHPSMSSVSAVLPGPDVDHLWTQVETTTPATMRLVDADGWGRAVEAAVPQAATTGPMPDGAGGLLFEGAGGLYRITPDGRGTVTGGVVLAVGAGDLLTLSPQRRGWRTTLRLSGGGTRQVPVSLGPQLPHGVLAPDSRSVVLHETDDGSRSRLSVVDLTSGARRPLDVDVTGVTADGTVLWTPDAGRLLCVDAEARVRVVDPERGTVVDTPDLPPMRQLALRRPT